MHWRRPRVHFVCCVTVCLCGKTCFMYIWFLIAYLSHADHPTQCSFYKTKTRFTFEHRLEMTSITAIFDYGPSLVFATAFILAFVFYKRRTVRKYPPSLHWLPIVGSLPFMGNIGDWPKMMMDKSEKLGKIFRFYAGLRWSKLTLTCLKIIFNWYVFSN